MLKDNLGYNTGWWGGGDLVWEGETEWVGAWLPISTRQLHLDLDSV